MNRHEQLVENYEDALFKLLMESVVEYEGNQIQKEIEQFNNNPNFSVPPELDRRCLRTINKITRRKRALRTGKKVYRVFSKFSVAAVIAMALFTSAYAAFPEVRISTLNLLIEVSDISTEPPFVDNSDIITDTDDAKTPSASTQEKGLTAAGYMLPESITAGRNLVRQSASTSMYEGADGSIIIISVQQGVNTVSSVNTENAIQIENLDSGDYKGVIADQEDSVTASIADMERSNIIVFHFEKIDFSTAKEIINEFILSN